MSTTLKKPTQAAIDLRASEVAIIDNAVGWVAFIQVAPGDRRRSETLTQEAAVAAGVELLADVPHRHLAMIYAVDAQGRSTLAGTTDRAGSFTTAVTPA